MIESAPVGEDYRHGYGACQEEDGGGSLAAADQAGQQGVHEPDAEGDGGEAKQLLEVAYAVDLGLRAPMKRQDDGQPW